MDVLNMNFLEQDTLNHIVMMDRLSKFLFASQTKDQTTLSATSFLDQVFALHGCCRALVSDNGPAFRGKFQSYLHARGLLHMQLSPYHPQANGLADRMVQELKG